MLTQFIGHAPAMPLLDLECKVVKDLRVYRFTVKRDRQRQKTLAFEYVMELGFGNFGRQACQRANRNDGINVTIPPFF